MKPIDKLLGIMAQLRHKQNGCPWDIEQDFRSVAPYTIEEAYEVADAIERGDMKNLREELGDLLLQVVFHAQMASEEKLFTFDDVAEGISEKLIRRHPNVFAGQKVKDAKAQEVEWEKHKDAEKKANGETHDDPLSGVPLNLPGLTRAIKLQKKAERVGFDWANLEAVFEKLDEEREELLHVMAHENTEAQRLEEIGDMLFCVVNLARKLKVDPEEAIRFCNRKFVTRFGHIRRSLDDQQRDLADASLQEMNDLWDQAKIAEKVPKKH